MLRLGVTGTDTGVGKTVVATAIIRQLRARGLRVAAMKPVETGVTGDPADAIQLRDAAGNADALDDVCPLRFADPLAPMVAAERARRPIDITVLDTAFAKLAQGRDAIVVEGAGGLLVPIAEGVGYDTLFRRWNLDVIIVAANRLGALNHTLLTVRAAQQAGLTVRTVVLNTWRCAPQGRTDAAPTGSAGDDSLAAQTNLATLRALLPHQTVVSFPNDELVRLG